MSDNKIIQGSVNLSNPISKLNQEALDAGGILIGDEVVLTTYHGKDPKSMVESLSGVLQGTDETFKKTNEALAIKGEFASDEVAENMILLSNATSLSAETGRMPMMPPEHMSDRLKELFSNTKPLISPDFCQERPVIGYVSESEIYDMFRK